MQTSWHNILGSGHGPVCRLAPQTRIMAGVVLFTACIVAPATTAPGILVIVASTVCWIITCGTPWRAVMSFSMFGLAVFLPYFLLVPLILVRGSGQGEEWTDALAVPWGVFLHGMTGILVSTSTAMTLSPSDLRIGAIRLPVPGMVSAILLQIVHQTSELAYETRRVAAAFAIRGASTSWRTSMRLLSSIPKVWLPRVLIRADRVAAAMEVRGFCEADPQVFGRLSMKRADVATLSIAIGVLVLATALRLGVFG